MSMLHLVICLHLIADCLGSGGMLESELFRYYGSAEQEALQEELGIVSCFSPACC